MRRSVVLVSPSSASTRPAVSTRDGIDHPDAPGIDPQLGQLLIDAGRPAFRVEIPTEPPDRVERYEECGYRQAKPQQEDQCGRKRDASFAQPRAEAEAV